MRTQTMLTTTMSHAPHMLQVSPGLKPDPFRSMCNRLQVVSHLRHLQGVKSKSTV